MSSNHNGGGSDTGAIDLMGWDTVFALSLDALNASIVSQNTTPASFSGTDTEGGASVSGDWDTWIVTGGEGTGIYLKCPVKTGTLTLPPMEQGGKPMTFPLDGGFVTVEITLVANDSAEQLEDKTAVDGTGKTKVFQANADSQDPFQQPNVKGVSFASVTGYNVYGAEAAFNDYFGKNLSAFDAVFSAVRLEEQALDSGKQWLKPTTSLYALASTAQSPTEAGETYFGILSLTSPLPAPDPLPQQNFDLDMFSPFKNTKPPTNSVFAISQPLAVQNIVLQSASLCVMGSSASDFEIADDGITVTNKNTLNWGNFQWENDSSSTVTPVIAPGDFQLSLDGGEFHLSISQASFTTPDGTCNVNLSADQYFNFAATKLSDGNYYLTPDPGLGTNSIRADVTANPGFEWSMIYVSVVASVGFAFLGAALGGALSDALSSTATSITEGTIEGTETAIQDGINGMDSGALQDATNDAMTDATDAVGSGGENTGGRTGIFANKFKIWGGVIGGLFGIPIGVLPQIMTAVYNDKIKTGDVPTVDDFAVNFTGAVQWPALKSWQVTGGTFNGAFLLAGNSSSPSENKEG